MIKKITVLAIAACFVTACNVKKEEKGEMPELDVDVSMDSGELPEYEVNWADVNIGTRIDTVEIPKVVIVMEEEEVEVPYIDVDMPNGTEKKERTLMVEAEVIDKEHTIEIEEIWAAKNTLYVISKLTEGTKDIGDQKMRVSDQVTLNAPNLSVQHYIMGVRPERVFNTQYDYLDNTEDLKNSLNKPTVIYTR